jgi:NAD(P)-dependent dehydrogenase (short-subunit alcohol dehydrogenase family)
MQIEDAGVLVAGGASGLGYATADLLAERGARVTVLDLPSGAGRIADDPRLSFAAADVRDERQVQAAIDAVMRDGDLRVCVNCAGIGPPGRTVGRDGALPLERFREVIEVNLIGTFNVLRLAAAAMSALEPRDGERGVIVNTASVAAFDGQIGQVAYAASKAGIAGLTLPVARDLSARLIRCVTIAPGLFDTPLFATIGDDAREALAASVPHPSRLGDPAEYASLVAHAAENQMLNGEVVRLDGALRMAPR